MMLMIFESLDVVGEMRSSVFYGGNRVGKMENEMKYILKEVRKVLSEDKRYAHYEYTGNSHITQELPDWNPNSKNADPNYWIKITELAKELFGPDSDGYEPIPFKEPVRPDGTKVRQFKWPGKIIKEKEAAR